MKAVIFGGLPLTVALSFASLIAPANAQLACDFVVGRVGINCRDTGSYSYPNNDDRYRAGPVDDRYNHDRWQNNRFGRDRYRHDRYYNDRYNDGRFGDNFNGPGARRVAAIINSFYREFLGRNADPDGLNSYLSAYRNGRSLDWIRADIANSNEARNFRNRARDGFYRDSYYNSYYNRF